MIGWLGLINFSKKLANKKAKTSCSDGEIGRHAGLKIQ